MYTSSMSPEDIHAKLIANFGHLFANNYKTILEELKNESMFEDDEEDNGDASNEGFEGVRYDPKKMSTWCGFPVFDVVKKMYADKNLSIRKYEIGMVEVVVNDVEVAYATDCGVKGSALPYACYKTIVFADEKLVKKTIDEMKEAKKPKVSVKKTVVPKVVPVVKKNIKPTVEDDVDDFCTVKHTDSVFIEFNEPVHKLYSGKNTLMVLNERAFSCAFSFKNKTLDPQHSECEMYVDGYYYATGTATRVREAKAAVVHDFVSKLDDGVPLEELVGVGIDKTNDNDGLKVEVDDITNMFKMMDFSDDKFNYAMQGMLKYHNDVVDLITLFSTRLKFDNTVQELMAKVVNRDFIVTALRSYDYNIQHGVKMKYIKQFYTDYVTNTNFKRFVHVVVATTLNRLGNFDGGTVDSIGRGTNLSRMKKSKMRVYDEDIDGYGTVDVYNSNIHHYVVYSELISDDDGYYDE